MSESVKVCLECGDKIQGRVDKRFCSDGCRNHHNNKLNSDVNKYVRNVNNVLRKNRRILAEFNPVDKTKVQRQKLSNAGFDFSYHTNIYTTRAGKTYYFLYEYGYCKLEEDMILVVKREEYVE